MGEPTLNALLVFLAICAVVLALTAAMVKQKRRRFADRKEYQPSNLYRTFFCASQLTEAEVFAVLEQISRATDMQLGKLRPSDRFAVELRPERGWEFDDALGLLPECLQGRFGGDASDYVIERNRTIDDLMRAVSNSRKARGTLSSKIPDSHFLRS
jgi:hypothetical protein